MEPSASDFFEALERSACDSPESATQADTVFKFVLAGANGGAWLVDLTKGKRSGFVVRLPDVTSDSAPPTEGAPEPAATIHVDATDWVAMTTGKMNPMRAFMSGKIKVDGDIKLAVNLPTVVNMVDGYGIGTQGPIAVMRTAIENTVASLRQPLPAISPMPPRTSGALPLMRAGRRLLRNPTAFFAACRDEMGDTFVVDAFGYRLFCVFSATGVRSLWALPEEVASKALADLTLLSHKAPVELFEGRRTFPHDLFAKDDVQAYLGNLQRAVDLELADLGDTGVLEAFAFAKRLAHRMGLASWGGEEAASPKYLPRLATLFDRIDMSESFVHPHKALFTIATRKARERAAMREIEEIFAEILRARTTTAPMGEAGLFERICESWAHVPSPDREVGIARDVIVIHMGSQSNLFAAMAWTLLFLLQHPDVVERIRAGDDSILNPFSHEAIRMTQRSIVLRRAVTPIEFDDGEQIYRLPPGTLVTTMVSVSNTTAAPWLAEFDISNYRGSVFARSKELPTPELVTTYGHGKHTCPAHRFSTSAITQAVTELVRRFDLEPLYEDPNPRPRQLGGVARADRACPIAYSRREAV
jgi:cytochrome P450